MKDLEGKNCFITGAAKGIGCTFSKALAKEGMNLFLIDIDIENLEKVKGEIQDLGGNVHTDKCDVSRYEDFKSAAEKFHSKLGKLDLLINNAGIAIGGNAVDLELEDWKEVLDINLWSIIHSIKVFLHHMLENKSGHIVNVSSGAGVFGSIEPLPYIASKFAVVGISEALFGRLHRHGINVSVIVPSYVRTSIFSSAKIRYSEKLMEDVGEEKLREIYDSMLKEMESKAMLPDRAVKKYIKGIKNNQLYIYDLRAVLMPFAMKGTDPHKFEQFLINYTEQNFNANKDLFKSYGINVEDYL